VLPVLAVTLASLFSPSGAQSHTLTIGIALLLGFVIGICGHITGSKPLIIVALVVIGLASLYVVAVFESGTFS
jgi:hypothetical protein